MRTEWFTFGIQLQLSVSDLKVLEANNHDNQDKCFILMLEKWLNGCGDGEISWKAVVSALIEVGFKESAEKIVKEEKAFLDRKYSINVSHLVYTGFYLGISPWRGSSWNMWP